MKYKVGDFVTFYESYEIAGVMLEDIPQDERDDFEVVFATVDVNYSMLEELDTWEDNQIEHIDEDGDIKFADFPWTWPVEVIRGLSEDQRDE